MAALMQQKKDLKCKRAFVRFTSKRLSKKLRFFFFLSMSKEKRSKCS